MMQIYCTAFVWQLLMIGITLFKYFIFVNDD
jgi:hypothetical protein